MGTGLFSCWRCWLLFYIIIKPFYFIHMNDLFFKFLSPILGPTHKYIAVLTNCRARYEPRDYIVVPTNRRARYVPRDYNTVLTNRRARYVPRD